MCEEHRTKTRSQRVATGPWLRAGLTFDVQQQARGPHVVDLAVGADAPEVLQALGLRGQAQAAPRHRHGAARTQTALLQELLMHTHTHTLIYTHSPNLRQTQT